MEHYFKTELGKLYVGRVEELLASKLGKELQGRVQLLLTSPPFPLNHKKAYGNHTGEEYVKWLSNFAPVFAKLLKPDGSIVIEIGNAWEPKRPVQSLMSLKALLAFAEHQDAGLRLCQEFVCYNRARLPSPAQWVTVNRIRVKDSYTHVWWLATNDKPKSNNRNVPKEYSRSMKRLLERRQYNAGARPSGYVIGKESFFTDNGGAIPSNLIEFSNTQSSDPYLKACKEHNEKPHPARMPKTIPEFFIKFLTDKGDLVFDPFGGSNVTGSVAEGLGRRWVTFEAQEDYARQSIWRFESTNRQPMLPALH
ncbi:MAG TPA: site-specific DNA-methyltransferase [Pyrinomonadaceae bacterium]|jgi:site-specific DNA-methyltransferase (cytosine-N4-specific)